jgi:hypothetical protein
MRGFGLRDEKLCSSYEGNPFKRGYTLFQPSTAPADFPLYFFDNPINLDNSSDWEVVGACVVDDTDIQERPVPFFTPSEFASYEQARMVLKEELSRFNERLTVTSLTPVEILSKDPHIAGSICFQRLKRLSVLSAIPVWSGYLAAELRNKNRKYPQ